MPALRIDYRGQKVEDDSLSLSMWTAIAKDTVHDEQ
jgi:hypothetical protein